MALSRANLIAAVANELNDVLILAAFDATDTATNMKEVADRTFRALGVSEADLATASVVDGEETKAISYLRFFTIDKAVWNTSAKMNVAAGSAKANLREQHENLLRLWSMALAQAQAEGLPLPGGGQSGIIPIPYAGGISLGDYETIAAGGDRLPPLFALADIAIPGFPVGTGLDG